MPAAELEPALSSLLLYFGLSLAVVAAMLGFSWLLGGRSRTRATLTPFESGILPAGELPLRLYVPFYRVAVAFVIFDLEAVYLFAWAVALREGGILGFWVMAAFVLILFLALAYLWRCGILDWRTLRQKALEGS